MFLWDHSLPNRHSSPRRITRYPARRFNGFALMVLRTFGRMRKRADDGQVTHPLKAFPGVHPEFTDMHMSIEETATVKAPRKRTTKTAKPEDASKVKATIHLSVEAAKRLGVYAVMTHKSNSGVVEDLIIEHLRRFVVSDRAKGNDQAPSVESANCEA